MSGIGSALAGVDATHASAGDLPPSHITKYDKASYVLLTKFMSDAAGEMELDFLKPSSGLTLDSTLASVIKLGSPDWAPAKAVTENAGTFGQSVYTELSAMFKDWTRYTKALASATSVFDDTSDLAAYSAADFMTKYPDLANTPGGSGTSGTGAAPSAPGS